MSVSPESEPLAACHRTSQLTPLRFSFLFSKMGMETSAGNTERMTLDNECKVSNPEPAGCPGRVWGLGPSS